MLDSKHPSVLKYQSLGLDYHWEVLSRKKKTQSTYERGLDRVLSVLPEQGNGYTVLDFGSGTGPLAQWLAFRGFSVTGYEPYTPAMEMAREKVPEAIFTDILPPDPFDYVVSHNVGEHMEDTGPLVDAARRAKKLAYIQVAKPGMDVAEAPQWNYYAYNLFWQSLCKGKHVEVVYESLKEVAWVIR